MSLASMVRARGSVATVRRATRTRTAGGSTNLSYADVAAGVKVLLDAPDAEVAQRVFGQDVRCDLRAIVLKPFDLLPLDGISITAGWRAGEHFDVAQVVDFDQGRAHAHYEVALVRRPAGFP